MLYWCFRKIYTGQWVNVLFTVDGDAFNVKATTHRASIADSLGVSRTSLEVVGGDSDPRTGLLIELPVPPIPVPTRTEQLLAIFPREDWTADELRELVQLTAQGTLD